MMNDNLETDLVPTSAEASRISNAKLRKLNLGAGVLHLIQGLLMLGASQGVPQIKSFKKEITTSFLTFNNVTRKLDSETRNVGSIEIGLSAAIFLLLSAIAHAYIVFRFDKYIG